MDSVVKELLTGIFKVNSFYYLFINIFNVSSIVLSTYLYIVEKIVLSIVSFFITGIVSISMIYDNINDDRKLIKWKL